MSESGPLPDKSLLLVAEERICVCVAREGGLWGAGDRAGGGPSAPLQKGCIHMARWWFHSTWLEPMQALLSVAESLL